MANRERIEEEFEIPLAAMFVLIGKGGQVVNKIRSDTGAYVHISEKNGKGVASLRGNAEQVKRATAEIKTRVEEFEQFNNKGKKKQAEAPEEPEGTFYSFQPLIFL